MPGLFSSRRRGSSASRPTTPSTHSAALAAASAAAIQRPPSNGGLSSAAAAAALRSATSTPEPVGSIQTKRMVRRGSQSSVGSGSVMGRGFQGRGGLQRRDSGGSMTERTFRSPSPGQRNNSITSGTVSPGPYVPPVPAIPSNLSQAQQQRSSSLDPPPNRVASPTGRNGRTLSMDRASQPPPISTRRGNQLSNVTEELERSDSNRKVNFSRPIASPPQSPTSDKSHYTHGTGAWFSEPVPEPSTSSSEPKADALTAKMARIQAAAGQPVHHTNAGTAAQGSHLHYSAQPTITGTAVSANAAPSQQPMETVMVYDANSRTFVPKLRPKPKVEPQSPTLPAAPQPKPGQYDPNTRTIVPVAGPAQPMSQPTTRTQPLALNTDLEPPPRNPARLSPTSSPRSSQVIQKQPSTVYEEPEEFSGAGAGTAVGGFAKFNGTTHQRTSSLDVPQRGTSSTRGRNISTSPSPQRARFSASPVVAATKHDPPARDVSPAKPALKHSHSPASSVRTNSPLANFVGPKSPGSETSDTMSQDGFVGKKKKSVRVSFDEQPHEIEASTAAASPKLLARDKFPMIDDLDDEELMKPRPALPSFGSVRKNRVVAEKVTEMAPERHEASNDHAIGGILRNANGAAKPTSEPIPPEVTSKEAADYASDESDEPTEPSTTSRPGPLSTSIANIANISEKAETSPKSPIDPVVRDFAPAVDPSQPDHATVVPQINLSPPTPGTEEFKTLSDGEQSPKPRSSREIVLPGGWDGDNEAEVESVGAASATVAAIDPQSVVPSIEPVLTHSPEERSPMLAAIDEDTDSDDSAAFSDAAEDLSDLEGGFASLDAIAVSPMTAQLSRNNEQPASATSTPDSPTTQKAEKKAERGHAGSSQTSGDWTQATAYWSNLSKVQREQIEREHLSDDEEVQPVPATRKIKKAAPKPATGLTPATASSAAQKSAPAHREAQPAQSAMMKKTMRAQPGPSPAPAKTATDGPVRMRRSMRDGSASMGGGMAASSLRNGPPARQQSSPEPRGALQKKSLRPDSSGSLSASSAGAAMTQQRQNRISQDSSYPRIQPQNQSQPVVSARLQKELTNDSDSESSFKKKRRGSVSTVDSQGRFAMKRSMRGGPVTSTPQREERPVSPTPPRAKGKDSFSIRSLSPTGSFFGRKKNKELRESIRGPSVDASSTRMTTMRSSQASKPAARQAPQPPKSSRFKSRFVDSDDSDDNAAPRGAFRSRFVDSDDEDDMPLAPVRGIPRRQGQEDGDSTDLEDSDDQVDTRKASRKREKLPTPIVPSSADIDKAMEAARKKLGMDQAPAQTRPTPSQEDNKQSTPGPSQEDNKQGTILSQGSLRKQPEEISPEPKSRPEEVNFTPDKKRRTFMGSILRRNRSSQQSVTTLSYPQGPVPEMPSSPLATSGPATASPIAASARPQSPTSPGKLVRRSSAQPPRMKRGDSSFSTATAPPMMGQTPTDNWPLPPVPKIPDNVEDLKSDARPATSDGNPAQLQRSASGQNVRFSESADSRAVYSSRTGKKKKFGMLRRAFRLDD